MIGLRIILFGHTAGKGGNSQRFSCDQSGAFPTRRPAAVWISHMEGYGGIRELATNGDQINDRCENYFSVDCH